MRIWDINPGYLNRQSLLGEHRELHGIVSIIANGKKGYAHHPETIRWIGYEWALYIRHEQIAAEMLLRNFKETSPVSIYENKGQWPSIYIDEPAQQFMILKEKYLDKDQGRITLPKNVQQLWSQHKYSVMARDLKLYKSIGQQVAAPVGFEQSYSITRILSEQLRIAPSPGGIKNALQHMWGYISEYSEGSHFCVQSASNKELLREIQRCVLLSKEPYLMASTSLSELAVWV